MTASFWWILLACAVYGGLHSLLAAQRAKDAAARRFGDRGLRWYRLFFSIMGALTFAPVLGLVAWLPDGEIYRIPGSWVILTLAIQGLAGLGLLCGVGQTGGQIFLGLKSEPVKPRLVTDGLYRWVRHPLYTCGLLIVWLTPLMSWNILALDIGVTVYILVGMRLEERRLLGVFGADYAEYKQRTPALIPRIKY